MSGARDRGSGVPLFSQHARPQVDTFAQGFSHRPSNNLRFGCFVYFFQVNTKLLGIDRSFNYSEDNGSYYVIFISVLKYSLR